ncbi:MAG: UDP-N-acetylmuramoyl-tripeptide--D-alanyl-D-alanine ligase [Solirubrobacteraceae bacterium]
MRDWTPQRVAQAAGGRLVASGPPTEGPQRVVIDSREVAPGDLFFGLAGARDDGGRFAARALEDGAWGVVVGPHFASRIPGGVVIEAQDPLAALQSLARAWRRELAAQVVGITGSTGKTTTKDILAALLVSHRRTVASPLNLNTEIGLPLAILAAPPGTEVLVLELAMRGAGQIAELAAVCEPNVGVIVNIGPAHLEQLGSLAGVAAAKAELLGALPPDGTAIIPADEPLLEPHLHDAPNVVRFGPGGQVSVVGAGEQGVVLDVFGEQLLVEPGFRAPHLLSDLCAAVAAAHALGVRVEGEVDVELAPLRGERVELIGGVTLINDCYNANPLSMRAAIAELAADGTAVRRLAVIGDMLELGAEAEQYHLELGELATDAHVLVLITVGSLAGLAAETYVGGEHFHAADADEAAGLLAPLLARGDVVLVKGSRGVGLERVALRLALMRAGT